MKLPAEKPVFDEKLGIYWLEDEDLLCGIAKPFPRTLEDQQKQYDLFARMVQGRRVCFLLDATEVGQLDKENREFADSRLPMYFKAIAIIAHSSFGKLMANTFMSLSGQTVPMHLFETEQQARKWLSGYL